jgi:hypothetical protein
MIDNPQVDDPTILEEDALAEQGSSEENQATVLLSLEELIKNHIASIDTLKDELKKHREMFADSFINNETYRENEAQVKEANKKKSQTREQILNQPAMRDLGAKIKSLSSDLRERQSAISDYLLEYQRMSGATEIEGHDGEMREIINSAKLIKRASKEIAQSKRK